MKKPQVGDTWYRVEDRVYASSSDEFGEPSGPGHVGLLVLKFQVTKVTPCGVRLNDFKVVLDHWSKKYACPTLALAIDSLVARKKRQVSILNQRVRHANDAVRLAEQMRSEQITADNRHAQTSLQVDQEL